MQLSFFNRFFSFCKRFQDFLALGFFVLLVGVFFYKTILLGALPVPTDTLVGMYHPWRDAYAHTFQNGVPFKNFLITDPVRQQIPWRKQVVEALKSKKLPLWDATSFSGVPLLANIQSGAFYPLNILFFVFPFDIAWTLLIISQPLLAGIFLYLFLRQKHLHPLASLIGAVSFSFSGFSIAWLTWGTMMATMMWLPLSLLSFEKIHEASKKTRWRLLFIFSIVSAFFAGHIQIFFYSMAVCGAYALWIMRTMRTKQVFIMHGIIPTVILAVTFPVWIRFISYIGETSRAAGSLWTVEGFFIPLKHLLQFVIPDFFGNPATLNYWGTWNYGEMIGYIGVVGLFFALFGISKNTGFWVGVIVLSLLFAIDTPVAKLPFLLHIPGLSSLQPTRLLSIVDFGLSILAAYGMDNFFSGERKKQMYIGFLALLCVFVGVWVSVLIPTSFNIPVEEISVVKRNLILPSIVCVVVFFVVLISMMRKTQGVYRYVLAFGLLFVLSFDLIRFGWKFTPFTNRAYFFPETEIITELQQFPKPFRVIATDDRLLPPNVLSFYNIESISGYDPIHSLRYEEYIAAMERGEPNITPPFGFGRIVAPKTITSPLLSLLNVQYVLSMDPIVKDNVRLLREEGTTKLYKYVGGVKRAYFAEQIIIESTKEGVMKQLYAPSFVPGKTAVLEAPLSLDEAPLTEEESVVISSYEGELMNMETNTNRERLLVIGNMYDPHWQVFVDGGRHDIVRVNFLFFGVVIPQGNHHIQVMYR